MRVRLAGLLLCLVASLAQGDPGADLQISEKGATTENNLVVRAPVPPAPLPRARPKVAGRQKCSAGTCGKGLCAPQQRRPGTVRNPAGKVPRSLPDSAAKAERRQQVQSGGDFGTLLRRALNFPTGRLTDAKILSWMISQMAGTGDIIGAAGKANGGTNTAYIDNLGAQAFKRFTWELKGCTSVVLLTATQSYVTHWWEDVSFSLAPAGSPPLPYAKILPVFRQTVINAMDKGTPAHAALPANFGAGQVVQAFLIHPMSADSENAQQYKDYRSLWDEVQEFITSRLTQATEVVWKDVPYRPIPGDITDTIRDTKAQGKLVLSHDPNPAQTVLVMESTVLYNREG